MVEHLTLNQGVQGSSPWRRIGTVLEARGFWGGAFLMSEFPVLRRPCCGMAASDICKNPRIKSATCTVTVSADTSVLGNTVTTVTDESAVITNNVSDNNYSTYASVVNSYLYENSDGYHHQANMTFVID